MNVMDPEQWSNRYDSGCTGWDLGRSPAELRTWAAALPPRRRILIPGCGRGYELADLVALGHEVTAIDYAEGAIAAARRSIGELAASIRCADFFACDLPSGRFDLCYERTFLCSLPRPGREEYGRRVASLLKPGGRLVGVFLYGQPEDDDPPVPLFEDRHGGRGERRVNLPVA